MSRADTERASRRPKDGPAGNLLVALMVMRHSDPACGKR